MIHIHMIHVMPIHMIPGIHIINIRTHAPIRVRIIHIYYTQSVRTRTRIGHPEHAEGGAVKSPAGALSAVRGLRLLAERGGSLHSVITDLTYVCQTGFTYVCQTDFAYVFVSIPELVLRSEFVWGDLSYCASCGTR